MVLELAIQSIENKLRLKSNTMLGNYEFYYAAGILCRAFDLPVSNEMEPKELYDLISKEMKNKKIDQKEAEHLASMIQYYKVEDSYDAQMWELFLRGYNKKGV